MPKPDLSEFDRGGGSRPDRCLVMRHLDALEEQDRVNVTAALADGEITHASIARYLTKRGHRVSDRTVGEHRNEDCCCVRANA